jgi:hypothetical protein
MSRSRDVRQLAALLSAETGVVHAAVRGGRLGPRQPRLAFARGVV